MSNISNTTKNTIVSGTSSADSIYNSASDVRINAGAGNDTVSLGGTYGNITVSGGTGNDLIYNATASRSSGRIYQYAHGDGNDTIWNWSTSDSISLGVFCYHSTLASGSNLIVSIPGSGSITLKDAIGENVNLIGWVNTVPSGAKLNYTKNTTFTGTSSADSMLNYASGALVSAGAGNDYVFNSVPYQYKG